MFDELKREVFEANMELPRRGLVTYTWGNVSGIDRERGVIAIKPSGVEYGKLTWRDIVLVDCDGGAVEGALAPSSDLPTHLVLYTVFPGIGGITHTHSAYATARAQAMRDIPCYGTTHADYFYGTVPCTRPMTPEELTGAYEHNTGRVITEAFAGADYNSIPAVLVANHGPFTWGRDAAQSVFNSVVLEEVAKMALRTEASNPGITPISRELLDRHYLRKHGENAYYGQPGK